MTVKNTEVNNGLEAWRGLNATYDSNNKGRQRIPMQHLPQPQGPDTAAMMRSRSVISGTKARGLPNPRPRGTHLRWGLRLRRNRNALTCIFWALPWVGFPRCLFQTRPQAITTFMVGHPGPAPMVFPRLAQAHSKAQPWATLGTFLEVYTRVPQARCVQAEGRHIRKKKGVTIGGTRMLMDFEHESVKLAEAQLTPRAAK